MFRLSPTPSELFDMLKESVTAASPVNFRDFPTPVMMPSSGVFSNQHTPKSLDVDV